MNDRFLEFQVMNPFAEGEPGQPIPEDAYLTVGITTLQEHLTTRFGNILLEEEYIEWSKQHGI